MGRFDKYTNVLAGFKRDIESVATHQNSDIDKVLEPGGIDHLESDRNSQFELNRNSQCTLAN